MTDSVKRLCRRQGWEPLTERHVQAAWYDRSIRPAELFTSCGESVHVLHPGTWNLGPGPDFRNAVVEIAGRRITGDVEVHLTPGDWTAHGHADDPEYRKVAFHVTWNSGPSPATLPKGIATIWIGRSLVSDRGFSPDHIDVSAYPFARLPADERPCCRRFSQDAALASEILIEAGAYRLMLKARRIGRMLNAPCGRGCDRRQLFYSEVMNALGYSRNSGAFREVAAAVPLETVLAEPYNAESAFMVAAQFVDWRRGGVRPGNSPEVRLRSAARLFADGWILSLLDARDFSPDVCRKMVKALSAGGLMGRGRAGALLANVIVPFAIAEGRIAESPRWLPPEDLSEPVRLTAYRLFGRDHNPSSAYAANDVKVQGLIQIHREYCLQIHPACEECVLAYTLGSLANPAARSSSVGM